MKKIFRVGISILITVVFLGLLVAAVVVGRVDLIEQVMGITVCIAALATFTVIGSEFVYKLLFGGK